MPVGGWSNIISICSASSTLSNEVANRTRSIAEAIVPRSEQSRHERYSQGERMRAVIVDGHKQPKGPQIVP